MEAYPLHWPEGWKRTPGHLVEHSKFKVTPDRARRNMLEEIRRLVGWRYRRDDVIISTNLRLRKDGEPYATQRPPKDQGVAVYFKYKDKPMVFACDQWSYIHDNFQAIAKTIEALRGIERWGASDMMERAFTGFVALEHQPVESWSDVLQMGNRINKTDREWLAEAERHFRLLCKDAHPDKGGSDQEMARLIRARDQARVELGGSK
ncbi:MAG: J domain-containing protein [Candidatus Thiodiazotropha sp. (ex Codakia orbicularis)]|nr:J domain-containing protein [Candidatus Thiodiazotropha sp. (ex Codakia orbicularis)]